MQPHYILEIELLDKTNIQLYEYYAGLDMRRNKENSGVDLVVPHDVFVYPANPAKLGHGIRCRLQKFLGEGGPGIASAFWLVPRSSIAMSPFRMANSIGLIDKGYRGEIIACVDLELKQHIRASILSGTRLFQIAAPDLGEIREVRIIDGLNDETMRMDGGFGSTGGN